jgi:hypothetical protein
VGSKRCQFSMAFGCELNNNFYFDGNDGDQSTTQTSGRDAMRSNHAVAVTLEQCKCFG